MVLKRQLVDVGTNWQWHFGIIKGQGIGLLSFSPKHSRSWGKHCLVLFNPESQSLSSNYFCIPNIGSKQPLSNGGLRVSNSSNGKNGKNNDHRIILNPFKWSLNSSNNKKQSSVESQQQQRNPGNGGVNFYAHHPRYYHQHQMHHHQPHQAQPQKPACRLA